MIPSSSTSESVLDFFDKAVSQMMAYRPLVVGIVCNPASYPIVNRIMKEEWKGSIDPFGLLGVPVYMKANQQEDYRAFFYHEALREYLAEPSLPPQS